MLRLYYDYNEKNIGSTIMFVHAYGLPRPRYHYKQGIKSAEARVLKQAITEFKYSIDEERKYKIPISNE